VKVEEPNPMQKRELEKMLLKHKKALQEELDTIEKGLKVLKKRRVKRTGIRKTKR
jgi:hypothetical protein